MTVKFTRNQILLIVLACVLLVIAIYFVFFYQETAAQPDAIQQETIIQCESRQDLAEIVRMDLSDVIITDIQYEYIKDRATKSFYTYIFVFLRETVELETKKYYFDEDGGGMSDPNLKYIPPGLIVKLKEIDIELHQIQKHGGNYNQAKVGPATVPFEIHWFQIDESYDGKSNVVLVALVPCTVNVDVSQIIAEGKNID